MRVGYMTNAWGQVVGHPAGVTSVKDLYYLSTGSDIKAIKAIRDAGFNSIEIFDGNLMNYADKKNELLDILKNAEMKVLAVYTGANFIYEEILADEFHKIETAAEFASELGAKHLVLGGGGVRAEGAKEDDYKYMGENLNKAMVFEKKYNLITSYHPHLGTIVETLGQIDKLMLNTDIKLCPDTGHINAAGGDSVKIVEKYKDSIEYIHLKDFKNGEFLPLGKGEIDFPKIFKILENVKYDITIEADGYMGKAEEAAKTSSTYLKQYFNF